MTRGASTRVRLEKPAPHRLAAFLEAVRRSRALHAPWVSPPSTPAAYRAFLRRSRDDRHLSYLICMRGSDALLGVVNVSEIVRGVFRSAYLGYYAFTPYQRRGLMTEAVALVVDDAFRRRRLHRLEANVQPGNRASIRLVKRLGFRREGFSRRYLRVRGRWCDHERWAILAEDRARVRRRRTRASRGEP
jgi:[ribosomal protein S5]-alanine N-acetyltransferase